jgi:hypothetical protein
VKRFSAISRYEIIIRMAFGRQGDKNIGVTDSSCITQSATGGARGDPLTLNLKNKEEGCGGPLFFISPILDP